MRKARIAVVGAAAALPMIFATAANAASWHSVSGTVYEGGDWYKSSTVRTVGSSGTTIQISLQEAPSKGIQWRLVNAKNGNVFGSTVTIGSSGGAGTLATNVLSGTLFQNDFRQDSSCNFNCGSYNFSGSEYY